MKEIDKDTLLDKFVTTRVSTSYHRYPLSILNGLQMIGGLIAVFNVALLLRWKHQAHYEKQLYNDIGRMAESHAKKKRSKKGSDDDIESSAGDYQETEDNEGDDVSPEGISSNDEEAGISDGKVMVIDGIKSSKRLEQMKEKEKQMEYRRICREMYSIENFSRLLETHLEMERRFKKLEAKIN